MAERIHIEILTPESCVVARDVDQVIAPGVLGSFGVLPRHAPLLSSLQPGRAAYRVDGETHAFDVGGGFAEVTGSRVTLLVESAHPLTR
jgi:F-type H+-transporting ATPase subunit epsilon